MLIRPLSAYGRALGSLSVALGLSQTVEDFNIIKNINRTPMLNICTWAGTPSPYIRYLVPHARPDPENHRLSEITANPYACQLAPPLGLAEFSYSIFERVGKTESKMGRNRMLSLANLVAVSGIGSAFLQPSLPPSLSVSGPRFSARQLRGHRFSMTVSSGAARWSRDGPRMLPRRTSS